MTSSTPENARADVEAALDALVAAAVAQERATDDADDAVLEQAVTDAKAALLSAQNTAATLRWQNSSLTGQVTSLTAQVAALQAQLATPPPVVVTPPVTPPVVTPPVVTPPTTPAPSKVLLGLYNGGSSTDDAAKSAYGRLPDIASTYYQGSQRFAAGEMTRVQRGVIPWLTVTSKGSGYTLAQIGSGAADAWIDRYADDAAKLNAPLFLTLDHEFEVKLNQKQFGSTPPSLQDYAAAWTRWRDRIKAKAPKALIGYWFGGFDKTKIDGVGSLLPDPDWFAFDPYSTDTHPASETFEQTVSPGVSWLKGRLWFKGQPIYLGEFGSDKAHGDTAVAAYMSNLRPRMKALGLAGGLLFSRDKTDTDGQFVGYKIDAGTTPLARAAFAASLAAS